MSFSDWSPEEKKAQKMIGQRMLIDTEDALALGNKERDRKKALEPGKDEITRLTDTLTQQKALDRAKKQAADYKAGVVDLEESASGMRLNAKNAESELSDFAKYSQKNDYDRKNQDAAWASASKYRQSDAKQQIDNQQYQQQTSINQENRLRRDDNTRAIDGFKMNF